MAGLESNGTLMREATLAAQEAGRAARAANPWDNPENTLREIRADGEDDPGFLLLTEEQASYFSEESTLNRLQEFITKALTRG